MSDFVANEELYFNVFSKEGVSFTLLFCVICFRDLEPTFKEKVTN